MINYKIIDALKSLNKKEFKKFGEFVYSPYFNKNENVRKLYDVMSKYYPSFENRNFTIESIFRQVFPDEKYNYFKINNIISDLFQLFESYLNLLGIEKEKIRTKYLLLKELSARDLANIYEKAEENYKSEIQKINVKDENYYNILYNFYAESLNYNLSKKPIPYPELIQSQFDSFLNFSVVTLLKLYMYMHHEKKQNKFKLHMEMFDNFSKYVIGKDFSDNPAYMIYKGILMLELNQNKEHYLKLKEIKKKYSGKISNEDYHNLLIFMIAFCAETINKSGDESFYKEEFEVFKEMIDCGMHDPDNIMYTDLINIYKSACQAEEYDWGDKFLNDFIKGVPEKDKDNVVNVCSAFKHYRKKNYKEALEYYSKTNFQWFILKIFVKTITLRILYESKMYEEAYSFIDSYRHYLQNETKLLEDQRNSHLKYVKYTSALIKLKTSASHETTDTGFDLINLRKQIESMENNFFGVRNWLLKKVNEIN